MENQKKLYLFTHLEDEDGRKLFDHLKDCNGIDETIQHLEKLISILKTNQSLTDEK